METSSKRTPRCGSSSVPLHPLVGPWAAVLVLLLGSCSDPTEPSGTDADGGAHFGGMIAPNSSTFVLERMETPVPGREPIRIELLGSNLQIDAATERVTLDVAIRNAGAATLYRPAWVAVGCFDRSVTIVNADFIHRRPGCRNWGFDYSASFGEDGALLSGETSLVKPWTFHDPGLEPFAFSTEAHVSFEPDHPRISGVIFTDGNRNGVRDPYEDPFEFSGVVVRTPRGALITQKAGEDGSYAVHIEETGLYTVNFQLTVLCDRRPPSCFCLTTPSPLQVLILPGPDGTPQSYEKADFGVVGYDCNDPYPSVILTGARPEEIPQDFYHLLEAKLSGDTFVLRVGFSGCSADHPFTLYAGRGFMESNPVATWMILAHDDRDEPCDAYFERTLQFDLYPILREHIREYGRTGVVRLDFRDWLGNGTVFYLRP